jgi:hypothetical protein
LPLTNADLYYFAVLGIIFFRTGLCAGVGLVFRLPGPLLINNILMKLQLMFINICQAGFNAWLTLR